MRKRFAFNDQEPTTGVWFLGYKSLDGESYRDFFVYRDEICSQITLIAQIEYVNR